MLVWTVSAFLDQMAERKKKKEDHLPLLELSASPQLNITALVDDAGRVPLDGDVVVAPLQDAPALPRPAVHEPPVRRQQCCLLYNQGCYIINET